jgi:acyl-CoA thioesterase FadM
MQKLDDGSYIGWPRVSAQCRFMAPLTYEDEIEARISVERIGVKSITYTISFYKNGALVADGSSKAACCICKADHTLQSIEIPPDYRRLLEGQQ